MNISYQKQPTRDVVGVGRQRTRQRGGTLRVGDPKGSHPQRPRPEVSTGREDWIGRQRPRPPPLSARVKPTKTKKLKPYLNSQLKRKPKMSDFDITKTFGSQKYLKAADLEGQPRVLTIRDVVMERVSPRDSDESSKPVLYFSEWQKGLVSNTTNGKAIVELHGKRTGDWLGKTIELYPTTTEFAGKTVDCIRVRKPAAAPVTAGVPDDETPF